VGHVGLPGTESYDHLVQHLVAKIAKPCIHLRQRLLASTEEGKEGVSPRRGQRRLKIRTLMRLLSYNTGLYAVQLSHRKPRLHIQQKLSIPPNSLHPHFVKPLPLRENKAMQIYPYLASPPVSPQTYCNSITRKQACLPLPTSDLLCASRPPTDLRSSSPAKSDLPCAGQA
jgi:hypothetical protein